MKITLNKTQFCSRFLDIMPENFSYEGLEALFDYFEEYEKGIRQEIDFDPITFCFDFTEYKNLKELQSDYDNIESMEDLEDKTTVIMIDDESFIIESF